jgi:hypothetical protein
LVKLVKIRDITFAHPLFGKNPQQRQAAQQAEI